MLQLVKKGVLKGFANSLEKMLEFLFDKVGAVGGLQAHKVSSQVLINFCTSACNAYL